MLLTDCAHWYDDRTATVGTTATTTATAKTKETAIATVTVTDSNETVMKNDLTVDVTVVWQRCDSDLTAM